MSPHQATAIALLAAFPWGTGNVAQKTILEHLDGWSATGITSLVGAAVLLPFALREGRGALPSAKGSLPLLLGVSLLFTFATTVMQFGYGLTTVTNAGFLVNTAAVLTPILAWAFLSQRPHLAIWPASLAVLLGIFLMAGASWRDLAVVEPGQHLPVLKGSESAVKPACNGVFQQNRPEAIGRARRAEGASWLHDERPPLDGNRIHARGFRSSR